MDNVAQSLIELGIVVKNHGHRGSFVVRSEAGQESALSYLEEVFIGNSKQTAKVYQLSESAWMPKGWKLTVAGISGEESAQGLRGMYVFARREDLRETAANEFYVGDLVGLCVWDSDASRKIGELWGVEPGAEGKGGGDRWWIRTLKGNRLPIPANRRFVEEVNPAKGYIRLRNLGELG